MAKALSSEELSAAWGSAGAALTAELETYLRAYLNAARSTWPALQADDAELVRYLAERANQGALPPTAHAGDLLLAYACSRGVGPAIATFQRLYGPVIDRVLLHRRASTHLADDARQIVQERLLVSDAEGSPPKIAQYRGMGPLKSWIATAAARTVLMLYRAADQRREDPQESRSNTLRVQLDPELELLKERYRAEVEEAIVHALSQLGTRDRTLLRLQLAERMSIDALGALYAVNRATAARWLAAARRALLHAARERLREQLRMSETECNSVMALVHSRLDVSLLRRLSEG